MVYKVSTLLVNDIRLNSWYYGNSKKEQEIEGICSFLTGWATFGQSG